MQPQDPAETVENRPLAAVFRLDDLVVDTGRATVTRDGRELPLPRLTFDLLVALIEAAPRIVSPDELMDRVWPGLVVNPETVSQRIKLLRDSLEDDPKSPRYVAGVRGRGYRLVPLAVRVQTGKDVASPPAALPDRAAFVKHWAWIVPLVAIAVAGIWFLIARGRNEAPIEQTAAGQSLPARSVAVLAFEDRGGAAGTDILAQGIPETVLYQLSRMPGLTVIARGSSFAFQGQREDMRVIGRKLNVRYLLEGSVQTAGNRLRVTSSLIDAETGASIWSKQFDPPLQDVFDRPGPDRARGRARNAIDTRRREQRHRREPRRHDELRGLYGVPARPRAACERARRAAASGDRGADHGDPARPEVRFRLCAARPGEGHDG